MWHHRLQMDCHIFIYIIDISEFIYESNAMMTPITTGLITNMTLITTMTMEPQLAKYKSQMANAIAIRTVVFVLKILKK